MAEGLCVPTSLVHPPPKRVIAKPPKATEIYHKLPKLADKFKMS